MFVVPNLLYEFTGKDAWISVLVSSLISICLILFYYSICSKFPGKNIIEISEIVFGKLFGKFTIILFFIYFTVLTTYLVRRLSDFLLTIVMPETPLEVLILLFILVVLIGGKYGIVTLARSADVFFNLLTVLFIIVSILLIPHYEVSNILPQFESSVIDIVKGTFTISTFSFLDLIVIFMIFSYVDNTKKAKKSLIIGLVITNLAVLKLIIASIMILGVENAMRQAYTTFTLVKVIGQGQQIIRFEILLSILWLSAIFFKAVFCFYSMGRCVESIFKLKNYQVILTPLAVVVYSLSILLGKNIVEIQKWKNSVLPLFSFTFAVIIPIIIYIVYLIRKQKNDDIITTSKV
jgi:spore germination protein KB